MIPQSNPRRLLRQRRKFRIRMGVVFFIIFVFVVVFTIFAKYYADNAFSVIAIAITGLNFIAAVWGGFVAANANATGHQIIKGDHLSGQFPTVDPMASNRKDVVDEVCQMLESPDTSCIKLIGIYGIGKSTLAELVGARTKEKWAAGNKFFLQRRIRMKKIIWLDISSITTFQEFSDRLFSACKKSEPDLYNYSSQNQAREVLQLLQKGRSRLIVLDFAAAFRGPDPQFPLAADPAFKELVKALNSQPCVSCILMTDCPCELQGCQGVYQLSRIKEFRVKGLKENEGIDFLKRHTIPAIDAAMEKELRDIVNYYGGHPGALQCLVDYMHRHPSVSISSMLEELRALNQLPSWEKEIHERYPENDYQQLTQIQSEVLRSFAVYRRPVSFDGGLAVISRSLLPREEREIKEALDTLVRLCLVEVDENDLYLVPALIANCALTHFKQDWDENNIARKATHEKAALHYLGVVQRTRSVGAAQPQQIHRGVYDPIKASLFEAVKHYIKAGMQEEAIALVSGEGLWNDIDFNI